MGNHQSDLFKGLQALSDSAFPKRCATCGREYSSPEDFFSRSQDVNGHSGLKKSLDEDDTPIVELFRNCECGSTLMDVFSDRRDFSEKGLKRRRIFGELLVSLEQKGLSPEQARTELLKLMRGETSEQLEQMGIRLAARPSRSGGGTP